MADDVRITSHVSEKRFQLLVDSVTDYAIYMLDPDGRIATWNQGARRYRG
jgi:PAS domain-containing protein